MLLTRQSVQAIIDAAKCKADVVVIRNTAANGDDYYCPNYVDRILVFNTGSYTQNIYLPGVAESTGRFLYIAYIDAGGTNHIYDNDDSYYPSWSDLQPDADGDDVLLHNSGQGWAVVFNGIA